jgi:catechol 2,3-dioxygenase-like lactoylglutathione lyase family enzyme
MTTTHDPDLETTPGRSGQATPPNRLTPGEQAAHGEPVSPAPTPQGGRIQLALNVDDIEEAVAFYSRLFGTAPAKRRPGYANFAVAQPSLKLVLLENPGNGGTLNHLGVEVNDTATVHAEIARLTAHGLFTDEEMGTTCCFATQDKVWVTGPDGERWEVYTVLADSPTFGTSPTTVSQAPAAASVTTASAEVAVQQTCCGTTSGAAGTACC